MRLLIISILFISNALHADVPQTIDNYLNDNPKWLTDPPSQNFLSARCGILNLVANQRLVEQKDAESQKLAKGYADVADMFFMFADFSKDIANISDDAYKERLQEWTKIYGEEVLKNWKQYNNAMHGDVGSDLMTCNKTILPAIQSYVDLMIKQLQ